MAIRISPFVKCETGGYINGRVRFTWDAYVQCPKCGGQKTMAIDAIHAARAHGTFKCAPCNKTLQLVDAAQPKHAPEVEAAAYSVTGNPEKGCIRNIMPVAYAVFKLGMNPLKNCERDALLDAAYQVRGMEIAAWSDLMQAFATSKSGRATRIREDLPGLLGVVGATPRIARGWVTEGQLNHHNEGELGYVTELKPDKVYKRVNKGGIVL